VIGYVPLVETELSKVLGISGVENACQTIAHRRLEVLDLGQIQNHYFFTKVGIGQNIDNLSPKSMFDFSKFSGAANLKPIPVSMEIDGQFKAQFEVAIGAIFNSRSERGEKGIANPTDGLLDVLLLPGITALDAWKYRNELASGSLERVPGCAVMHGKRIVFQSPDGLPFFVGDKTVAKIPAVAEALTRKIKMIVGKERTF
jgi:diacylglycerol kinase family enzyme